MEMVSDPPFGIERVFKRLRKIQPAVVTSGNQTNLEDFFNFPGFDEYRDSVVNYGVKDGQYYGLIKKVKHLFYIFDRMVDEWYYGRIKKL